MSKIRILYNESITCLSIPGYFTFIFVNFRDLSSCMVGQHLRPISISRQLRTAFKKW